MKSNEDTVLEKTKETIKGLINKNHINYIFMLSDEKSDTIKDFISKYKLEPVLLNDLSNLSDNDRKNNKDYITIMNDNIDALRKEIYNS